MIARIKLFRLLGVFYITDIFVCHLRNSDPELSVFEGVNVKGFMYMINKKGPRTEPCGTPKARGKDYINRYNIISMITFEPC